MGVEHGGEKKIGVVELSKNIDKAGFYGGIAVYVLAGIPLALSIAVVSGGSWALTQWGEGLYKKWTKNK